MNLARIGLAVIAAVMVGVPSMAMGAGAGCADTFKGKRITLVVPNAAGGGYDIYARALAPALTDASGVGVRIVNMPAAGGLVALKHAVQAQPNEAVMLIESAIDVIAQEDPPAGMDNWIDMLTPMGTVYTDPEAWFMRKGLELDGATHHLVASVSTFEGNVLPVALASHILDIKVNMISGYAGSAALMASLLRGEADFTSTSLTTALHAAATGEAKVGLVMTEGPAPGLPDIPYLAGAGGEVWKHVQGLPEEQREERLRLASLIAKATPTTRMLFAPASMDKHLLDCLREAVSASIASDGFKTAAEAQQRPVDPQDYEHAKILIDGMLDAFREARTYLTRNPQIVQDARVSR
jgi:tripartite-type tricarboxylate transporter receptor subunit TctC